jgi:hypothetical protein
MTPHSFLENSKQEPSKIPVDLYGVSRTCENCNYSRSTSIIGAFECHFNPPTTAIGAAQGIAFAFPILPKKSFCYKHEFRAVELPK